MEVKEELKLGLESQTLVKSELLCGLIDVKFLPNVACSWSVDQMPSVGGEVFPSNILGVMPESADLKHKQMEKNVVLFLHLLHDIEIIQ